MQDQGDIEQIAVTSERIREMLADGLGMTYILSTTGVYALHDLFLCEARQQGLEIAAKAWSDLQPRAMHDIVCHLREAVWGDLAVSRTLPAGTELSGCMTGCVMVGSEVLGFDVDRPGLHNAHDLPTRPGGSNLQLLRRYIDERSRGLPCGKFGRPALVDVYNGHHHEHHLRFPPSPAAAGAVLRRSMNYSRFGEYFCAFTDEAIRSLAEEIVADMTAVWTEGHQFASRVKAVGQDAHRIASTLREMQVSAVTIDVGLGVKLGDRFSMEFHAWDHAFRRGIAVHAWDVSKGSGLSRYHTGPPPDYRRLDRSEAVAEARALGADGWIGGLARAVLAVAPGGPAAMLSPLARSDEAFFTLQSAVGSHRLRFHWHDGEICVSTEGGDTMDIVGERIRLLNTTLPEVVVLVLPGRPLHHVFNAPFKCGSLIANIENCYSDLVITLEPDRWLVNCRAHKIWQAPTPPASSACPPEIELGR